MSGANSWLQRQRKTDLAEIAQRTGLKGYESLKKSELELTLDEWLAENSTTLSTDPKLASYYASRARIIGSPVKRDSAAAASTELKVSKRRATKAVEDLVPPPELEDEPSSPNTNNPSSSTAVAHTPGRALALASRIPLPATPADVASAVDRSTALARARVSSLYQSSGVAEAAAGARDSLSSVHAVVLAVAAFELYFLRQEILADRYAFTLPALARWLPFVSSGNGGGVLAHDHPVHVPDMFLLLTASFWGPALLWTLTSALLPAVAGYFFNFSGAAATAQQQQQGGASSRSAAVTRRSSAPAAAPVVDPLAFSVVRALLCFVVYGQGITFGGWLGDGASIARVNAAVYGGYKGMLVGAAITGLFSIYDAVLKK